MAARKTAGAPPPLKVMLVEDDPARLAWVMAELHKADLEVVTHDGPLLRLEGSVVRHAPDVIIIEAEAPTRDTLEQICLFSSVCPKPIVLFTEDDDSQKIRRAVKAGVSAYIVDGLDGARIRPVLDAALARFEAYREMTDELEATRSALADREAIDEIKRRLMREADLDESEAYTQLRKYAMDRRQSLAQAARQLLKQARS
jgi:response regulator NasT